MVNSYRTVLGLQPGESIFQTPNILKNYHEIKAHIMENFNEKNKDMSFDFEKKIYIDEIENFYSFVVDAYINKD